MFIITSYNYFLYVKKWGMKKTYCGTIEAKVSQQEGSYKHSYQTNYFIMKFEGVNHLYSIKPNLIDFTFHKQGDRLCYNIAPATIREDRMKLFSPNTYLALGGLMEGVLFIILLACWLIKLF